MITSRFETQPIGELAPPPQTGHSALLAAQRPFYQVSGAAMDLVPQMSDEESRKQVADKLDVINGTLSDPRLSGTQQAFNMVSEFGSSIAATAPLAYLGGEIGVGAAILGGGALRVALPEAALTVARTPIPKLVTSGLSDYLPSLTSSEIAKGVAQGYGAYKGFTIPEHVVENYHKQNDTLDVRSAIKDWSNDNWGFMLPVVALAAGYIPYKIFQVAKGAKEAAAKAQALVSEHQTKVQAHAQRISQAKSQATRAAYEAAESARRQTGLERELSTAVQDGKISQKEHDWFLNYVANPDSHDDHLQGAFSILKDAQIPYDRATGRVWFPLLENSEVKQLKQAISDEVSARFTKVEQRQLSEYIVHNRMDAIRGNLRENPNMVTALKGYTDLIDKKLSSKVKALSNLDEILEAHGAKGLKKNEVFSQKRVYKHLKKMGIEDTTHVPYTVPDNVAYKLKLARTLDKVERQASPRYRQWFMEGMHEKIKEKMKAVKILTPEEELKHLRDKLITPKGLIENFQRSRAYHRLRDLSEIWANAKHLLDRVHLEHEYGKQEAFNNVLKDFVKLVDSSAERLANPNKVVNYLKTRVENASPKVKEFLPREKIKVKEEKGEAGKEEGAGEKSVLTSEHEAADKIKKRVTAKDYFAEESRYQQFKENTSALEDLISCAWSKLNG